MRIYNNRPDGTVGVVAGGLERIRVGNDGKVGIGTTSPATELEVNGAVTAATYWGDGSNLTGISGTTDGDWTIVGNDMYSAVSGNVGIGTVFPTSPLTIQTTSGRDIEFLSSGNKRRHHGRYPDERGDDERPQPEPSYRWSLQGNCSGQR
jgi:hypothetical protein